MTHLQNYLNEIEAEAAKQSQLACANAALIELAGDTLAKINAAADLDVAFLSYHLDKFHTTPSVTIQSRDQDAFITALEAAGYRLHQLPVKVIRNYRFDDEIRVRVMIEPGVEALLRGLPAGQLVSVRAFTTEPEETPCAA